MLALLAQLPHQEPALALGASRQVLHSSLPMRQRGVQHLEL
jgi:hypothetical protein